MIILVDDYWDCECKDNYIHPMELKICLNCGVFEEDGPSSRKSEVKKQIEFYGLNIADVMKRVSKGLDIQFESYSWEDMLSDLNLTKEEEKFARKHLSYSVRYYE